MFRQLFGITALAALILTSCSGNGCYETKEVKVFCRFYTADSLKAVEIDSMSVWGVGSDSLLYQKANLSEMALELNPNAGKTQYVIQVNTKTQTFMDTISLYHTNQPWFQSMDCGCMVFSTLDSVQTAGPIFLSSKVRDSKIINKKTEHVSLYL